jgi:hypothetical protein
VFCRKSLEVIEYNEVAFLQDARKCKKMQKNAEGRRGLGLATEVATGE